MLFKSLSVRLKTLTLIWVTVAAASIALTLLLSCRLEGGAAAINDVGSLRMQTYRLGLLVRQNETAEAREKIQLFNKTLTTLQTGDPTRPLFLPNNTQVRQRMAAVQTQWRQDIQPMFQAALTGKRTINRENIADFIININDLAHTIEIVNTRYIDWLRLFQTILLVMVLVSSVVTVVLLSFWVIQPLKTLQNGVQAVHDGKFGVQVPLEDSTEFSLVGKGFNQMSARLQQLYTNLEQEVADKTRDLTQKNNTLATLYEITHQLGQPNQTAETAAQSFLQQIMASVPAQAGSIRLIDIQRQRLDLIAQIGLPENLQTAETCQRFDDCLCGQAVQNSEWQPIHFFGGQREQKEMRAACQHLGYNSLRIYPITDKGTDLGMMTLYFTDHEPGSPTSELIDALCRQLGSTLSNIRLAGESRQLAVLQERNLLAQGLHDSIAQTLTFLNLQVQMLESALETGEQNQIQENLNFIREGIQECYDDVRELLLNFRTKISRKEFAEAIHTLAQRFEQQTRIPVDVEWQGNGPPLSAEQQLQFIFILQESLSNIRKHAQADHVRIQIHNKANFAMTIHDNGRGFDTERLDKLSGSHVGLNIMRERAHRIHAQLHIHSQPNSHTQVSLTLPQDQRILE